MGPSVLRCALAIALAASLGSTEARAYIPTVTSSGKSVRWSGGQVHLNLAGNPINRSGLSDPEVFDAVVHGLERWQQASGGTVGFDYWQGRDPNIYEPNSAFNGQNSIYFVSNASSSPNLTPNVLGLTQVWYDTDSGKILEADIVLNDANFEFTTDEKDTSGYGTGMHPLSGGSVKPSVFIENVITHELGHALGLSHSAGLQSTMLFMESPEQAHLGCDEQIAIHALYPSGDAPSRGSIEGNVVTESGAPLFGAHMLAISRRRGVVLATALTDKGGHYSISALEPGSYFLMAEPYFAGPAPLPSYYSSMNIDVCSGKPFGRSFLTDGSRSKLESVEVPAGGSAQAPSLIARCGGTEGAAVNRIESSPDAPSALYDGSSPNGGFGVTDRLVAGMNSYRLPGLSGHVEIHAMAYSLYSPIRVDMRLVGPNGEEAPADVFSPSFTGESGYQNFDSYLVADGLLPGDYTLEVSSSQLDASMYPAGPIALDSVPFLVITGSQEAAPPPLSNTLPVNGRCEAAESFYAYSSPPGNPPRNNVSQDSSGVGVGFCGSLSIIGHRLGKGSDDGKGDSGSGPGIGAIAGWLLPWILMALLPRVLRSRGRVDLHSES